MQYLTYAHYKPNNEVFYIGKGSEFRASTTKNRNKQWHDVVAECGGFKTEILGRWETEAEALDHERFLIDCFRSIKAPLVNITSGVQGVHGLRHSDATKTVLRQKSLNNGSVERCIQMANDPAMIQKRRAATIGKKRTEESKAKMAKAKFYKSRKIVVCEQNFESISALAKFLGLYRTTVRRWIDAGQMIKIEDAYHAKIS